MKPETSEKLARLNQLAQTAQNPKILIEEMRLVSGEAFQLQEDLMAELDKEEAVETDIETVQILFETRELVWDTINQIALREKEVKEHTQSRTAFEKHKKEQKKHLHDECGCNHHQAHECCGGHEHHTCCGGHHHDDEEHCECGCGYHHEAAHGHCCHAHGETDTNECGCGGHSCKQTH